MLPQFPQFKRLQLSDQKDIEKISSEYEPYSDFDFSSIWSWNVNDNYLISELNGNLVVIFNDHFTDTPFYSYLGNQQVNRTLKKIFAFADSNSTSTVLQLIPEQSLKDIDLKKYIIEIDPDNSDYIYDIKKLSNYSDPKLSNKRRLYNYFARNHPTVKMSQLDLYSSDVQKEILALSTTWEDHKNQINPDLNVKKEMKALKRFLEAKFNNSYGLGLFEDEKLISYSIYTWSHHKQVICHFAKSDVVSNRGITEFFMREAAIILLQKGYEFLNYEEDLGISGLRYTKNSFLPSHFLKKYFIRES